jgi:hypothetical protein
MKSRGTSQKKAVTVKSEKAPRPSAKKMHKVSRDAAESRESSIPFGWHVFREYYPVHVAQAVERLFDDNALNIQTVMMLQAADCLRLRSMLASMGAEDAQTLSYEKLAAAQLRHLRLMAERFGANATADNQLVQVPIDLQLPLPFPERGTGDDNIVS